MLTAGKDLPEEVKLGVGRKDPSGKLQTAGEDLPWDRGCHSCWSLAEEDGRCGVAPTRGQAGAWCALVPGSQHPGAPLTLGLSYTVGLSLFFTPGPHFEQQPSVFQLPGCLLCETKCPKGRALRGSPRVTVLSSVTDRQLVLRNLWGGV